MDESELMMAHDDAWPQTVMPANDLPLTTHHSGPTIVGKVGGSLLEISGLADRLRSWLAAQATSRVILVIGGGAAAELVRQRDRLDKLGDDKSHWLAIRAMTFNSYLVEALLPNATVVTSLEQCRAAWETDRIPILDPHAFLLKEVAIDHAPLPHSWTVTSDTIAARVARVCRADELVLLKSTSWADADDLDGAARQGIVDEQLPREAKRPPELRVRIENLRLRD